MDGFIDKFAQRKNAQEMIRANAMAEAEEKERMETKIAEYETAVQEIRRCNLQNLESAEKVKELLAASLDKIEQVQKKDDGIFRRSEETVGEIKNILAGLKMQLEELPKEQKGRMEEALEEAKSRMEELLHDQNTLIEKQDARMQELMEAQKKTLEELLHATEDFNHKEAVKVYRNVQAVIEAELPKQTEEIKNAMKGKGGYKGLTVVWILTLIAALANVVIEVMRFMGYL